MLRGNWCRKLYAKGEHFRGNPMQFSRRTWIDVDSDSEQYARTQEPADMANRAKPCCRVFAYGTLRNGEARDVAMGHTTKMEPAELPGYRKEKVEHPRHAYDAVPAEDESLSGDTFPVDEHDLQRLDEWEKDYERKEVTLADGEPAWIYVEGKPVEA